MRGTLAIIDVEMKPPHTFCDDEREAVIRLANLAYPSRPAHLRIWQRHKDTWLQMEDRQIVL